MKNSSLERLEAKQRKARKKVRKARKKMRKLRAKIKAKRAKQNADLIAFVRTLIENDPSLDTDAATKLLYDRAKEFAKKGAGKLVATEEDAELVRALRTYYDARALYLQCSWQDFPHFLKKRMKKLGKM